MSADNTKVIFAESNLFIPLSGTLAPAVCNSRMVAGCTTNNTATVTTTGSFLKAGIEVGKVVRGPDITVGTTILAIPDATHITLSAVATGAHAGLTLYVEHPSYPNAPPRPDSEDDDGPIENLLTLDRGAEWVVGTPGSSFGDVFIDLDLKANKSVAVIGLLGCTKASYPLQVQLAYRTATGGYDSSAFTNLSGTWGQWTGRDFLMFLSSATTMRYVRLWFTNCTLGTGWSVGKMLGATAAGVLDLGVLYGPNSTNESVPSRLVSQVCDGTPYVTKMGESRRRFTLIFPRADSTLKDRLVAIGDALYPVVFLDGVKNVWYEVIPSGPAKVTHLHGVTNDPTCASDLWSVSLEVVSLY